MTQILSELRVSASMDASGFTAGSTAIEAANRKMAESGQAAGAAFAAQDAAAGRSGGTMVSLSKSYIDGYAGVSRFSQQVAQLQTQFELGNVSAERAAQIYTGLAGKFHLYANATDIAAKGNRDFALVVDQVNGRASVRVDMLARETAATQQLTQAQQAQAAINSRLGVLPSGSGAGSAQASADAFLGDVGGLEGAARARAQQVAQAFTSELDGRLTAGTGKSARDSASVFQSEFTKLDEISRLRAEQTGQAFTEGLNSRLIAGISKSARDSASVFQAEFSKIDEISRLRAEQVGQEFQRSLNERMGIGTVPKSARESASVFQELGQQVQVVGTKFSGFNAIAGYGTTQFMALTAAMRHGFDAMAAGMSPMRVVMMEMGNLSYGLSGTGGVLGALKAIASSAIGLLSPFIVTFAAITAAIGYSVIALMRFQSIQMDIQRQITGAGRASGASLGDINNISAIGPSYKLSIAEAANLATALASTGKVGVESLAPIVKLGHDFAATLGISAKEATKELAKSFADPVKGAASLNERLGFLDATTKNLIDSLVTQGRRQEAIAVLTDRVKTSIANATEVTSAWARGWDHLSNSISNGTTYWGRFLDRAMGGTGGASIEKQINDLTIQLLDLQRAQMEARRGGFSLLAPGSGEDMGAQIAAVSAAIDKLAQKQREANKATEDAKIAQRSLELKGFVDALDPAPEKLRKLVDQAIGLNQALSNPALGTYTASVRAAGAALSAMLNEMDPVRNAIAQADAQIRALDDRSAAGLRRRAEEQARRQLSGTGLSPQEMERQVSQAGQLAGGGATRADADIANRINLLGAQATVQERVALTQIAINSAAREGVTITGPQAANLKRLAEEQALGTYAMKQQADAARIEAETIGMTTGAATAYRLEQERIAQARRNGEKLSEKNLADLRAEAQAAGAAAQALANRNIQYSIRRDSQTAFLTSEDVQIAEKLKNIYPDVATALNSVEAAQIRANNAVRSLSQEISGGLSTALMDVWSGTKTAGEAFKSFGLMAVTALQKMIIQLMVIGPLMRALQSGFGGGGGLLSWLFGGGGGIGIDGSAKGNVFDQGRIIHPYALGGITSDILVKPTYFPMANGGIGLGGEAGPEAIMPLRRGSDGRLGVSGQGGGGSSTVIHMGDTHINGSGLSRDELMAVMAQNNKNQIKEITASLPTHIAAARQDPRAR